MTKLEQMCESNTSHYRSNKLELVARQVVANGVQGTYAKYYSVPPADFEALREALAEQAEQEPVAIDWEPLQNFWRNNSGVDWEELESAVKCAVAALVAEPWIETNKALAKEIIELKKQAEQSQLADATLEPVARVTGYHGGRCVVEPLNRALVLPIDMALYAAQQPVSQEPIGEVVEVENSDMKSHYYAHLNVTLPEGTPVYANPVDYSKELKNVEEDISNMLKSVAKLEKENLELYETCLNQAKTIRKYQEKYTENLD